MNSNAFNNPASIDADVRRHVTVRARELGDVPRADDIDVLWSGLETPPNSFLFRAHWIDRSGDRALTGIWVDNEIVSRPLEAISILIHRWRNASGHLPEASVVASACAYLLDADCRHQLIEQPVAERSQLVPTSLAQLLHEPTYLRGEPDLPLAFCWMDKKDRAYRVEIRRDRNGVITFDAAHLPNSESSAQ